MLRSSPNSDSLQLRLWPRTQPARERLSHDVELASASHEVQKLRPLQYEDVHPHFEIVHQRGPQVEH